jgi:hypothetical protein
MTSLIFNTLRHGSVAQIVLVSLRDEKVVEIACPKHDGRSERNGGEENLQALVVAGGNPSPDL